MKELTSVQINFIKEHLADDLTRLLLSASKYPDLDIPFLADQIAARRQIKEKLPSWYANLSLIFPSRISAEQCSSEQTAGYKQSLVDGKHTMCDLTGGLGIDSYFFSRCVKHLTYIERFPAYCEAARHNFRMLGADNIHVINTDTTEYVNELPVVDVFYIDPARRGECNKRVFALSDCEPDLPVLLPVLLQRAPRVIAKLSPMADIRLTLDLLPGTASIHVLSVKNECKELLFVIERGYSDAPAVHCLNFLADGSTDAFRFTLEEEQNAPLLLSGKVESWLYEPNASILKAGAFKQVAVALNVKKLHVSSHLYTSEDRVSGFPGRIFQIEDVLPFNGKLCKTSKKRCFETYFAFIHKSSINDSFIFFF